MKTFRLDFGFLAMPLFLLAVSCTNDPGDGNGPPPGTKSPFGTFLVILFPPAGNDPGYSTLSGKFYDGISPSPVGWKVEGTGGSCKLLTPMTPFCPIPCGDSAACVDHGVCQDYSDPIGVGQVTVTGLETKAGAKTFAMTPISKNYQQPSDVKLAFPPFAEGEAVTFSASGDTSAAAFTVSAKGIPPLVLLNDSITLEDGKPVLLKWTPPVQPGNSRITVDIDISHHGGSKGKIECEGPDTGEMEIAADLVDELKALGISGFPKIEVFRKAIGVHADFEVEVVLESQAKKFLNIPGLISCELDSDCPTGQTCREDLQCK